MTRRRRKKVDWLLVGTIFLAVAAVILLLCLNNVGDYFKLPLQQPPKLEQPVIDQDKFKVQLFYFNRQSKMADNLWPVTREIDRSLTPLQATIELLITGKLTGPEKARGFETEFPNPDFKLKGARLKNGVLTLSFTEVPGFTTGGASRVGLLAAQIIKTAKQFPEVKVVKFEPEYLFQP